MPKKRVIKRTRRTAADVDVVALAKALSPLADLVGKSGGVESITFESGGQSVTLDKEGVRRNPRKEGVPF